MDFSLEEKDQDKKKEKEVSQEDEENDKQECAICLTGFLDGQQMARLPCQHLFHATCFPLHKNVLPWFSAFCPQQWTFEAQMNFVIDCPLCRRSYLVNQIAFFTWFVFTFDWPFCPDPEEEEAEDWWFRESFYFWYLPKPKTTQRKQETGKEKQPLPDHLEIDKNRLFYKSEKEKEKEFFEIQIRRLDGSKSQVSLSSSITVGDLRSFCSFKIGICKSEIRLIYRGTPWYQTDESKLIRNLVTSDCKIIHLIMQLRGS